MRFNPAQRFRRGNQSQELQFADCSQDAVAFNSLTAPKETV